MYLAILLLKSLDSTRLPTTAVIVKNINECCRQRYYCSQKII